MAGCAMLKWSMCVLASGLVDERRIRPGQMAYPHFIRHVVDLEIISPPVVEMWIELWVNLTS